MEIRMSLRLLYFTEWRQNPADFPHLPQTYWLTSSSSSSLPVAVPPGTRWVPGAGAGRCPGGSIGQPRWELSASCCGWVQGWGPKRGLAEGLQKW